MRLYNKELKALFAANLTPTAIILYIILTVFNNFVNRLNYQKVRDFVIDKGLMKRRAFYKALSILQEKGFIRKEGPMQFQLLRARFLDVREGYFELDFKTFVHIFSKEKLTKTDIYIILFVLSVFSKNKKFVFWKNFKKLSKILGISYYRVWYSFRKLCEKDFFVLVIFNQKKAFIFAKEIGEKIAEEWQMNDQASNVYNIIKQIGERKNKGKKGRKGRNIDNDNDNTYNSTLSANQETYEKTYETTYEETYDKTHKVTYSGHNQGANQEINRPYEIMFKGRKHIIDKAELTREGSYNTIRAVLKPKTDLGFKELVGDLVPYEVFVKEDVETGRAMVRTYLHYDVDGINKLLDRRIPRERRKESVPEELLDRIDMVLFNQNKAHRTNRIRKYFEEQRKNVKHTMESIELNKQVGAMEYVNAYFDYERGIGQLVSEKSIEALLSLDYASEPTSREIRAAIRASIIFLEYSNYGKELIARGIYNEKIRDMIIENKDRIEWLQTQGEFER